MTVYKSVRPHQVCDDCFSVFPWAVPQTKHTSDTLRAEDGGYFNFLSIILVSKFNKYILLDVLLCSIAGYFYKLYHILIRL